MQAKRTLHLQREREKWMKLLSNKRLHGCRRINLLWGRRLNKSYLKRIHPKVKKWKQLKVEGDDGLYFISIHLINGLAKVWR